MEYITSGVAAMVATAVTNPMEVVRTRQQVQGELLPPGAQWNAKQYSSLASAFHTIVKADGFRGLQKGLVTSVVHTFIVNSSRFGLFEWADKMGWLRDMETGMLSPSRSALMSCFGGMVGLTLGCPLLMVKTQMQIDSTQSLAVVGYQHNHRNGRSALAQEFRTHGMRGLWRGYWGVLPRGVVSSGVQMTTFSLFKESFAQQPYLDTPSKVILASCTLSSIVLVFALTPFDVINSRIFNQALDANGQGLLYRGAIDCMLKTIKVEGILALYKGLVANAFLVCPHFIIHMTLWEALKAQLSEAGLS